VLLTRQIRSRRWISTRKVDDVVKVLGPDNGTAKAEFSVDERPGHDGTWSPQCAWKTIWARRIREIAQLGHCPWVRIGVSLL
jgi:hypothetical protein